MDVFEAISGRRSVRSYRAEPVSRELLDRLVEAGCWAPTAGNAQPWYFVVLDDPDQIARLKSISPGMFSNPAFVLAVCVDREAGIKKMGPQGELMTLMDACMAAQNMLLAAHALGLGACVIRSFHQQAAALLLGCAEDVVPELLIAGGYPGNNPKPPRRKELAQIRFFNKWGEVK